jgi:hypothetical protein
MDITIRVSELSYPGGGGRDGDVTGTMITHSGSDAVKDIVAVLRVNKHTHCFKRTCAHSIKSTFALSAYYTFDHGG